VSAIAIVASSLGRTCGRAPRTHGNNQTRTSTMPEPTEIRSDEGQRPRGASAAVEGR
jgi:hypothetical protein